MIRLFIIEDHYLIVEGLRNRFHHQYDEIRITGNAFHVGEAVQKADPGSFDAILLDLIIPGSDPVENIKTLNRHFPGKPIVVLTSEESLYWMGVMYDAGVNAYLFKSADKTRIKTTLEKVLLGQKVFPDEFNPVLHDQFFIAHFEDGFTLKPSEKEILKLLSKGFLQKEISSKVGITQSGVEKVLRKVRRQLKVNTNAQLIELIVRNNII